MISENELQVKESNQADRHHSYDMVQKLTFLIIGAEFVFCGYMLLNADKLSGVKYSSYLFLISGLAGLFGILWRFCYNQTYHDNVHDTKNKIFWVWHFVQILSYWVYVGLTVVFFTSALLAGYFYVQKAEERTVSTTGSTDRMPAEISKSLLAISEAIEKLSTDKIRVEVIGSENAADPTRTQKTSGVRTGNPK